TIYRRPRSQFRVTGSLTKTETDDDEEDSDRGVVEASYLRYPWRRWYVGAAGRVETNESLGLKLRSQAALAFGPRLGNSNRSQLTLGVGITVNKEQGVDVEPTENVEGLFAFRWSFYTYDRPRTNLDVSIQYYPSLSDSGRHRLQLDAGIKREL